MTDPATSRPRGARSGPRPARLHQRRNRRGSVWCARRFPVFPGALQHPLEAVMSVVRVRTRHHLLGDFVSPAADGGFQPVANFGIVLEILLGVLAALADADRVVAEP